MPPIHTLILGASLNPERYSYKAICSLQEHGYAVSGVGLKEGQIGGCTITKNWPEGIHFHTVSLYMQPRLQHDHLDHLLQHQPQRVIFNPGTENPDLEHQLTAAGIQVMHACTLVLLSTHQYETA